MDAMGKEDCEGVDEMSEPISKSLEAIRNAPRFTVNGFDQKGRACSVTYLSVVIDRVDVGESSAAIYVDPYTPDIRISLKDYRRIKPMLHKRTRITGDAS